MSDATQSWPALSYLEGLRPGPDETVDLAILAAYSADLGTIGAALLALAGKDSDAGKGSPSDFADAVEQLRGKVRIVIQRGRLARMRRTPRIAAVLDQFVREVDFDEATHSWHPKVALVRMRPEDGAARWRLWVGSRNLTECVNRDIGMLLVSGGTGAKPIAGTDALARSLAERAGLSGLRPGVFGPSVGKIAWRAPAGITVSALRWSDGLGIMPIPMPPARTEEILIVSPFVDKAFLADQTTGDKVKPRRTLLTTMREIDRIGPSLGGFDELLALDAPEYPAADPAPEATNASRGEESSGDEEEQIGRGLHAKLLFWRAGRNRTLWLGSANATRRAWSGRNAEATLELRISETVEAGLKALAGSARCVPVPEQALEPDAAALDEEALERARAQVAARWGATLELDSDTIVLVHGSPLHPGGPHPDDGGFTLEVGTLTGKLRTWPRGEACISLGAVAPAERTEFVRLRVSSGDKGLAWLQRAPADPPFGAERDRAAFVQLLGARGFLLWVAGLLADDGREGEGDWTIEQVAQRMSSDHDTSLDSALPTLEDMLSAWARDRDKFREIERRVSDYLPAVLEQAKREDPDAIAILERFEDLGEDPFGTGRGSRSAMSEPKPFQDATVRAAIGAFDAGARRRFLVADEVGLGKTVVAKEVARRMSSDGARPLTIYYIANGHSVSFQNKARVIAFLDEAERDMAVKTPDRLSMIARSKRPNQNVVIYALTPATSFPGGKVRLTGGRKEERAFLQVLLEKAYPVFAEGLDPSILRLNVGDSWKGLLIDAESKRVAAPPNLTRRFREALATEFATDNVRDALERAISGDAASGTKALKPTAFVGRLRRALALATLRHQPPDLVILDEFQRYRQLLDEEGADPRLKALLEPDGAVAPPAILLLSATPYRLLSTRWEESQGTLAHAQLMDLIGFLAGEETRRHATKLFAAFGEKLRDIIAHVATDHPALTQEVAEAARLRDELRAFLTPVMSRTERDSVVSTDSFAGTDCLDASPVSEDFPVYRHLVKGFAEKDSYEALPYWSSIPLPAQAMSSRYAAIKRAEFKPERSLPQMTRARRNRLDAPDNWPDAKMRALGKIAAPARLALPWSAPSLEWWPVAGGWKNAGGDPKLLMFSRFRATPSAVASLLSFGVEAHCLPKGQGGYEKAYRRRRFKLAAIPGPVMAAFHPTPWLIRHTDPLIKSGGRIGDIRREIRRQILANLPKGIVVRATAKDRRRHRSIARTIAGIEQLDGHAGASANAWSAATGDDKAARAAVRKWRQTPKLDSLSPAELDDLVDYALSAPGVVLGRALYRHDPTILDDGRFPLLLKLSWQGLRAYLDNPVILASLPGKTAVEQVMRAIIDGGLESVLDEHFCHRVRSTLAARRTSGGRSPRTRPTASSISAPATHRPTTGSAGVGRSTTGSAPRSSRSTSLPASCAGRASWSTVTCGTWTCPSDRRCSTGARPMVARSRR